MADGSKARGGGSDGGEPGNAEETLPLGLPRAGDVVAGRYLIEREIGGGAMGMVLAARDRKADALVAIKFLKRARSRGAEASTRFLQEARATRALRSPYVVRVLDVGVLDVGTPYFVMEHLQGDNMLAALRVGHPLPIVDAVDAVVEACAAMDEAHARGIVHRDLKPANLFRTTNGPIKVLDFGISKRLDPREGEGEDERIGAGSEDAELTRTNDVLGSPLYMSPEQLQSAKHVDHRTDLWSLGVVLHRLLTSKAPFAGPNMTAVTNSVLSDEPRLPSAFRPEVPRALDAIVARCLRKDPAERYDFASSLGRALVPFGSARARVAAATFSRGDPSEAMRTHPSSRTNIAVAALVSLLVLAGVSGIALSRRGSTRSSAVATDEATQPTVRAASPIASETAAASEPTITAPTITTITTITTAPSGGDLLFGDTTKAPSSTSKSKGPTPTAKTKKTQSLGNKGKGKAGAASPASSSPWGSVIDDRK